MIVLAELLTWLAKHFGLSDETNIYRPVIIAPVIYCLVGFTLAPVAEEMLYRAVLYRSLRRWMRPVFAILLQALIFGLMHRYGLVYMSIALVSGLLFMGLYLWRRTLWSPLLVHATIDGMGTIPLLVMLLSTSGRMTLGIDMADAILSRARASGWSCPACGAKGKPEGWRHHHRHRHTADTRCQRRKKNRRGPQARVIHVTLLRQGKMLDVPVRLRPLRPHILW